MRYPYVVQQHPSPRGIGWCWAVWAILAVTAIALTVAAAHTRYFPGDLTIARTVQGIDLWVFDTVFAALNVLGSMVPSLILTATVASAFLLSRRIDLLIVYLTANSLRLFVNVIKRFVDRPRPSESLVRVLEQPPESSFPSGHVVNAILVYGSLAMLLEATSLPRPLGRLVQAVCLGVVILMGPARVYAGAHWPSDALGGYLWGLLLLATVRSGGGLVRRIGTSISRGRSPHPG